MGNAGGSRVDDRAELPLPDSSPLFIGTYPPANYGTLIDRFASPAPPRPYGFSFSTFAGSNPTGDWELFLNENRRLRQHCELEPRDCLPASIGWTAAGCAGVGAA